METAVRFEKVFKYYTLKKIGFGIKDLLFHLPEYIKSKKEIFWALRGVSFEVKKGESFGIMGRNGAGKSTILGLIAGVLKPTKGNIIVKGRIAPLLELGAGFHPELTGKENIILNGILLGMTRQEILNKMSEIVEFSELGEFIEQPIRTYSSGMLARLGFSIAVHIDPEILLIDEILAVGDTQFQKKCIDKMIGFKKRGITIIIVSHSIDHIKTLCNRVALIDKGKIKWIKNADEL